MNLRHNRIMQLYDSMYFCHLAKKHIQEDNMELLYVAGGIVYFVIMFIAAIQFYQVAEEKGFPQKKYLWICFLLGIIGYLLVIALPDRKQPEKEPVIPHYPDPPKPIYEPVADVPDKPVKPVDQNHVFVIPVGKERIDCPNCGTNQRGNRNVCINCGCSFSRK